MDQDDPEKRIADLERQLAEQNRGADLPPASLDNAAASRRFVASTSRMKTWLYIYGYGTFAALAALFAVMYMAPSALGKTTGWVLVVLVGVVLPLLVPLAVRRWGWFRKIPICVTSDGLTVNTRPGEVFAFRDAKLGLWAYGTVTGTALHLQCGPHRFVLGGEDHRIATNARLEAAPVDDVDGWLRASDFDELLTMIGSRSGLDVRGPAPGEPPP